MDVQHIPIADLILDPRLQMRAKVDQAVVDDYAEAIFDLPPVRVTRGPKGELWLTDGWQRHAAHVKLSQATIACQVVPGTWLDAFTAALGVNADHGLRRTYEDKCRAVMAAMKEPALLDKSDRELARLCKVASSFIGTLKKKLDQSMPALECAPPSEIPRCISCKRRIRVGQKVLPGCPDCKRLQSAPPAQATAAPPRPEPPPEPPKPVLPPLCQRCLDVGVRISDCKACRRLDDNPEPEIELPVTDDSGLIVPVRLIEVFKARDDFDKAGRLLTSCSNAFAAIEKGPTRDAKPLAANSHFRKFYPTFKAGRESLMRMRPKLVCVKCGGDGCAGCREKGWLTNEEATQQGATT